MLANNAQNMFRYCPNCKNELIHKGNNIHCNKCEFDYYLNPSPGVAMVLLNNKNQLYLGKRTREPGKGLWDMPGGFIDFYETAEQALRREMKEELNLELKDMKYIGSEFNDYKHNEVQYYPIDFFFLCRLDSESFDSSGAKDLELTEGKFFDLDKVPIDELSFVSQKKFLKKFLKNKFL
jgi:NAD+ diphosphatase